MQNKTFVEIRKRKNYSQARLAEEMHVPIKTIRNWERKIAIPSKDSMKELANKLDVSEREIVSIFEPEKTNIEKKEEEKTKMYALLIELFWGCNIAEHFLKFLHLLSLGQTQGVVSYRNYVFPFTRIITDKDRTITALGDESDNYIVLTRLNIISVRPVFTDFDVFTFDADINCPMFPTDLTHSTDSFNQKIRISFFNR